MTAPSLLTRDQLAELSTFEERFNAKADQWLAEHPSEAAEAERYVRAMFRIHPDTALATLPPMVRDDIRREMRFWVGRTNRWPSRREWTDAMLARYQKQPVNEAGK